MPPKQRIVRAAVAIVAAAALMSFYLLAVRLTGIMPRCLFKWATGWDCPGCGSQRALLALLHGDIIRAIESNLLIPFAIVYLALLGIGWLYPDRPSMHRLHSHITSPFALTFIAVTIIAWTIIRNLIGI